MRRGIGGGRLGGTLDIDAQRIRFWPGTREIESRARALALIGLWTLLLLASLSGAVPSGARGDQASAPGSSPAARLAAGGDHTCAVLAAGAVRCWGYGGSGQLGYGNTNTVGDDETPASAGPVDLGAGRTATAIAAGQFHTCAILDDHTVRCWGYGGNGRLGYRDTSNVGDTPTTTPDQVGPVNLGPGRSATAITAGAGHTCAILDDGTVRCWGYGGNGRLGYGNTLDVLDPSSVGPVNLGPGRTARAISAGAGHTCALLDDGSVRCWGYNRDGELGYGNLRIGQDVGDTPATTPDQVGPVNFGGRTATAISAGGRHTCAILDDGTVRCWGYAGAGQLGYGNTDNLGEMPTTTPDTVGAVNLGPGRTAKAITAGLNHSCAILDNGTVRCWGYGLYGRLGYGNTNNVGDIPTTSPGSVGPVDLGRGRTATAISAGAEHTCALLDNDAVRCWGYGGSGRLGYCNQNNVGDTLATTPGKAGPVNLEPHSGGAGCTPPVDPLRLQAQRARALRGCLATAARRPTRQRSRARSDCLKRYGRTPGRVTGLTARVTSLTALTLTFTAPSSDGHGPPVARSYLVKQSRHSIRSSRDFQHAQPLCKGSCRFTVTAVGEKIKLTITHLLPHSTYYYAVAARDNVSGRLGPRSRTIETRTFYAHVISTASQDSYRLAQATAGKGGEATDLTHPLPAIRALTIASVATAALSWPLLWRRRDHAGCRRRTSAPPCLRSPGRHLL